jgi:hypothetical protein
LFLSLYLRASALTLSLPITVRTYIIFHLQPTWMDFIRFSTKSTSLKLFLNNRTLHGTHVRSLHSSGDTTVLNGTVMTIENIEGV